VRDLEKMLEGMSPEERDKAIARLTEKFELQKKAVTQSRAFYKWLLEFVRNCMVVAALVELADRSGDWWVYGIAGIAGISLLGYCTSYIESLPFEVTFISKGRPQRLAIGLFALGLQVLSLGITIGLFLTINKIVTVQVQMTKAP
jgi:hypothetical protein